MKRNHRWILLVIAAALALLACKVFEPRPEVTPTLRPTAAPLLPTFTPRPSQTPEPPQPTTEAPAPTETVEAEASPTRRPTTQPTGEARSGGTGMERNEWKGLPIYPGATNWSDDGEALSYTVEATNEEVAAFYAEKMEALGWHEFASGDSDTMFKIYEKDGQTAVITVMEDFINPGSLMVILVVQ